MDRWVIGINYRHDLWHGHPLIRVATYLTVNGHSVATERGAESRPLNVKVFFASWHVAGLVPLFTCTCGDFGCGGYYVDASPTPAAWVLRNWYDPLDQELRGTCTYAMPWDRVYAIAQTIITAIESLATHAPGVPITSGGGPGLDHRKLVRTYRKQLEMLQDNHSLR